MSRKPTIPPEEEGFYNRWSRRKRDARESSPPESVDVEKADEASGDPAEPAETTEPIELPDVETIDESSNVSAFLSPEVDEKIRRVALRKLFHLDKFNIRDGLDDYDDDYTVFEPLGDIVTSDMRHQMEMKEKKLKEAMAAESDADEMPASIEERADEDKADEEVTPVEADTTDSPDALSDATEAGDDADDRPDQGVAPSDKAHG